MPEYVHTAVVVDSADLAQFGVADAVGGYDDIGIRIPEKSIDFSDCIGGELASLFHGYESRVGDGHVGIYVFELSLGFHHVGNNLPVRQFYNPVRVCLCKIAVVGDYQHQFVAGEFFEGIEDLFARIAVQCAGGFVSHNYLGILDESAGNGYALFLSAGQGGGFAFGITVQVNLTENVLDCLLVLLFALQFQGEGDVFLDSELVENVVFLEDEAYKGVAVAVKIRSRKFLAAASLDVYLSAVGCIQTAAKV